jgi:hypothetical protein
LVSPVKHRNLGCEISDGAENVQRPNSAADQRPGWSVHYKRFQNMLRWMNAVQLELLPRSVFICKQCLECVMEPKLDKNINSRFSSATLRIPPVPLFLFCSVGLLACVQFHHFCEFCPVNPMAINGLIHMVTGTQRHHIAQQSDRIENYKQ